MSHNLAFKNGEAQFAYADSADPWHHLGRSMRGLQTLDEMLDAAHADYTVKVHKVIAVDEEGEPLRTKDGSYLFIADSRATVRHDQDGEVIGLTTVGTRFYPTQNRRVAERAEAIVAASQDPGSETHAAWDTMGVLGLGERFFACLDLAPFVLDPQGIKDQINRYLVIYNGHDGKIPETYANTMVRAVCENTITAGIRAAKTTFKARHTLGNEDLDIKEAQRVLGMADLYTVKFQEMAETMLSIDFDTRLNAFDKVVNAAFPLASDATDRQKDNHGEIVDLVTAIYEGPKNAAQFGGHNGWTAWNAVVEFLDHHREGTSDARAATTMDPLSWVGKAKERAKEQVLALV
jgi:phage/plasmid-like protein (TIGR03299 family)